jgi:hypothetical protein
MAHNLSFKNGKAEAIYSGEQRDVWHRLGTYVGDRALTVAEVREVVDVPVIKCRTKLIVPAGDSGDEYEVDSQKCFATYRTDTRTELAAVGEDYTVIPFSKALIEVVEPVLDSGLASLDVAGLLKGGLMGWVMLKWDLSKFSDIVREIFGSEIQPFTQVFAAHAMRANQINHTKRRGVCHNTVSQTLAEVAEAFRVVHRANAHVRTVDVAADAFRAVQMECEDTARAFDLLKRTELDRATFKSLILDIAAPMPGGDAWDAKKKLDGNRCETVERRVKEKRARIFSLWSTGDGHTGDASAWEAYNGLVQSLDHDTNLWRGHSEENRALSLMGGPLAKVRNTVFASLLKHAQQSHGLEVTA